MADVPGEGAPCEQLRCATSPPHQPLRPEPSTLNPYLTPLIPAPHHSPPRPQTLDSRPWTLNPSPPPTQPPPLTPNSQTLKLSTSNHHPATFNAPPLNPSNSHPLPLTLPHPTSLTPQLSTLNSQPSTREPQPSTLTPQLSPLNSQPSALSPSCTIGAVMEVRVL